MKPPVFLSKALAGRTEPFFFLLNHKIFVKIRQGESCICKKMWPRFPPSLPLVKMYPWLEVGYWVVTNFLTEKCVLFSDLGGEDWMTECLLPTLRTPVLKCDPGSQSISGFIKYQNADLALKQERFVSRCLHWQISFRNRFWKITPSSWCLLRPWLQTEHYSYAEGISFSVDFPPSLLPSWWSALNSELIGWCLKVEEICFWMFFKW